MIGPDDYRGPYRRGDNDIAARYAADADRAIQSLAEGGHKPALFIADSALLMNGVLDAPKGWLQGVYERVRKAGGLAVADEVQIRLRPPGRRDVGLRHCTTWCRTSSVSASRSATAIRMGAVITRPEIIQTLVDQGIFFSTFGGNNVSCAAGMAVLDVLEREGLQENARVVGHHFRRRPAPAGGQARADRRRARPRPAGRPGTGARPQDA